MDASMNAAATPAAGSPTQTTSITEQASSVDQGLLDLLAVGAMQQGLGSLGFTVRDRAGAMLSNGFNEVRGPDMDRHLLLQLPAGSDYQLSLESNSMEGPALKCHASVGPLSIEANTTASYQAFIWQCDAAPATPAPAEACYWLADWVGVSRARAAIGETIELAVAGTDTSGKPAHVTWVTQAPQSGTIADKHALQTTFTCEAADESIPLSVVVAGDGCERKFSMRVACE